MAITSGRKKEEIRGVGDKHEGEGPFPKADPLSYGEGEVPQEHVSYKDKEAARGRLLLQQHRKALCPAPM